MRTRELIARVKRKQSPTTRLLYRLGKAAQRAEIPAPRPLFGTLWLLHQAATRTGDELVQRLYYQPMFRARCESCGEGLRLHLGIPYIHGDLKLRIGRDCMINGHTAFAAGSVLEAPSLILGDETNISYGTVISVSERVTLGNHVRIADSCYISDNPGHPLDAERRRRHEPVDRAQIKPVVIEDDVWLGTRVTVMPGVRIGRGSVVGAGAVVTHDLPSFSLAVGNPARVVRTLEPMERPAPDRLEAAE